MPLSYRHLILMMPLVFISGCLDGGFCIPGTPCVESPYADDVVIIKSLEALPSEIAPEQTTKIIAYVENKRKTPVRGIMVELFDYCPGLLSLEGDASHGPINLLGLEAKEVSWTLRAHDTVKLETTCPKDGVKIRVVYPFETSSRTTISFIDENEYQRRLAEKRFRTQTSNAVVGEGPLHPLVIVDDVQPIPAGVTNTVLTFMIENKGSGFPKDAELPVEGSTEFKSSDGGGLANDLFTCISKEDEEGKKRVLKFIEKKTSSFVCLVKVPDAGGQIEFTHFITATLKYSYEFRNSVMLKVKPKI